MPLQNNLRMCNLTLQGLRDHHVQDSAFKNKEPRHNDLIESYLKNIVNL